LKARIIISIGLVAICFPSVIAATATFFIVLKLSSVHRKPLRRVKGRMVTKRDAPDLFAVVRHSTGSNIRGILHHITRVDTTTTPALKGGILSPAHVCQFSSWAASSNSVRPLNVYDTNPEWQV
jgi:hypothetical protein